MIARTYKTRLYPSPEQEQILRRWCNALRGIWNHTVREGMREWIAVAPDSISEVDRDTL